MTAVAVFALAGALGLASEGAKEPPQVVQAPNFTAKGSDGKTHTLQSLTGGKTLVLYFIGHTCPINAEAVKYYKQIGDAYKGKVSFYGVIDTDEKGYIEWKREFQNKFSVLYDPELSIIRSYQAIASPWIVIVSPNGEVSKRQSGYSGPLLTDLNATLARAAGVTPAKIDLKGAPAEETFG